jgi:putative endonuclease
MFIVYILKSLSKNRYYVGQTSDLARRVSEHNSGHTKSTKFGIPWKIIWSGEFASRAEAVKKETQIKKRGIRRYLRDIGTPG